MKLRCKAFTWDDVLTGSDGVFSATEWGRTRQAKELAVVYRESSDENYRKVIAARPDKTELTKRLCRVLDFNAVHCVGEIGGAPYIQAQQIVGAHPGLRYLATDQDAGSNAVLSRVPMLRALEISTFDVKRDDLSHFDDAQWLITFAVDYALEDEDIVRVLHYLRKKKKSWALLSVSILDPPRYLRLHAGSAYRVLTGRKQRFHGWERSVDWFRAACEPLGLKLEDRGKLHGYHLLWISA
jgi:hypothetical protein